MLGIAPEGVQLVDIMVYLESVGFDTAQVPPMEYIGNHSKDSSHFCYL